MALSLYTATTALNVPTRAPAPQMAYSWSQPGVGAVYDPLKLATTPEKFERLRYVEVKHGRIAMLACLGQFATGAGLRFPGELSGGVKFSGITGTGFEAWNQLSIGDYTLILLSIGLLEINVMKEEVKGEFPGDLRNGLFKEGWDGFDQATKDRKINIELNNGARSAPERAAHGGDHLPSTPVFSYDFILTLCPPLSFMQAARR